MIHVHEVHVHNLNYVFSILHKFTSLFEIFAAELTRRITLHVQNVQFSTIDSWQQLGKYCVIATPSILFEKSVQKDKNLFVIKKCFTFFQNNLKTAI